MFLNRSIFYIVGLFLVSFGVSLTIKADLGAGAWDALNVGLAEVIGLTVGTWIIIVGIILIFLNAFLQKKRPEILAVLPIFLVGAFVDFWLLFILNNWNPSGFSLQLIILIAGVAALSCGIATYLQADFPIIPIDQFMISIHKRLGVSLGIAKTIGELTALLLAFLFKGPIGIGTIIVTISIGPLVQIFLPKVERLKTKGEHQKK